MEAALRVGVALAFLLCAHSAAAQERAQSTGESLDREARALFDAGSTAFEDARYEDALGYFRRAYELSGRAELLYNVGITADRLRRDAEALEAFEGFLARVEAHPKRREVEVRIRAIHEARADAQAPPPNDAAPEASPEAAPAAAPPGPPPSPREPTATAPMASAPAAFAPGDSGDSSGPSLVGPAVLGAAGLAGLTVAVVGIAGSGGCLDEDASGACIEENGTHWAAVGAWGGLGLAAVVGAVVWLVVGLDDGDGDDAGARVDARGLAWRF